METLNKITDAKGRTGVYGIKNRTNQKLYVGSAKNLYRRLNTHKSSLRGGYHHNLHLQRAWDLYGELNFDFLVIEETSLSILVEREQYWIDFLDCFKTGYNRSPTAKSPLGTKHSPEFREKQRKIHVGKKFSDEHKDAIHDSRLFSEGYGKSKYKGLSWVEKKRRWEVRIKPSRKGKAVYLGMFASEEEAAKNYDFYALNFYGKDNCHLNFPNFDYSSFTPKKHLSINRESWLYPLENRSR